jgi:hypothetical protein
VNEVTGGNPLNIPRLLLAAVVATAFLTLCGALLAPVAFPSAPGQTGGYENARPIFSIHLLAWLITSVLLAWAFPIGYRGGVPWAEGLRFGMLMGLLAGLPGVLHSYADTETAVAGLVTVVLWNVITWGIAGALIGTVYGPVLIGRRE